MSADPGCKLLIVLAYLPKHLVLGEQSFDPVTPSRESLHDEIQLVSLLVLRECLFGDYAFCDVLVRNDREAGVVRKRSRT